MGRTGWEVSGEWDEQQKIGRCIKDPSNRQRKWLSESERIDGKRKRGTPNLRLRDLVK